MIFVTFLAAERRATLFNGLFGTELRLRLNRLLNHEGAIAKFVDKVLPYDGGNHFGECAGSTSASRLVQAGCVILAELVTAPNLLNEQGQSQIELNARWDDIC